MDSSVVSVSELRDARLLLARLEFNPHLMENPYWWWPVADDGHGDWVQAGHGPVSSALCGKVKGTRVCHGEETEHHKGIVYKWVDFSGKSVVLYEYYHCKNPLCVVCFASGYAVREAQVIEGRIAEGVERWSVESQHVVLSPPPSLRELPVPKLIEMAEAVAKDLGWVGFSLVLHCRRMDRKVRKLVWSPHMHLIGFLAGGYVCRGCCFCVVSKRGSSCSNSDFCEGFEQRNRRGYEKNGWIAKVEPARKTVFGTAYYLMHHVSVKVGLKGVHRVRWCGLLGNRKFKARNPKPEFHVDCPVCAVVGHKVVMPREAYWGVRRLGEGVNAVADFDSEGLPNFPSSVERAGGLGG